MKQLICRRNSLSLSVCLGLALIALAYPVLAAESTLPHPNIVLILADDLGWSDTGPYGSEIPTPNLDRLAAAGLRFTQYHNTAKCFPSRACLLTGLYAQQCGMDRRPVVIKNAVTLGEVLRSAGYRTYMAGKHHGTENPHDRGFDRYFGLRDGACNYFNPGAQRPGEGKPAQKRPDRSWCIDAKLFQPYTPKEKDFYTTDYFTKYALKFLDEGRGDKRPFFLYLAFNAPHDPLMAWPEDIAKYRGKYRAGYEAVRDARYRRQRETGLIDDTFSLSAYTHRSWNSLSAEEKDEQELTMAVYAAMIDRMDQNIGKVLAKVKELGAEKNTLVIFTSDNGASAEVVTKGYNVPGTGEIGSMTRWSSLGPDWANVGNTPYRFFKNYSHEGGICTPFIVCWPRFLESAGAAYKAGGVITNYPGHFIDIMATLIDVSGAEYPKQFRGQQIHPLAGESWIPVLTGEKKQRRNPLLFQWSRGRAVRKGNWKLVSWGRGEEVPWELYKTETRNLADQCPDTVSALADLYTEWYHRVTGQP